MKQVDRGVRFYQWTRRRGRNIQIVVFGTILLIGCLGIAVVIGIINTVTGDDSSDDVAAVTTTATPTATGIALMATAMPTETLEPTATTETLEPTAIDEPTPTSTEPPAEPTATETESASNRPPAITEAGESYVQQAHEYLDELDAKLATIDPANVDEEDWGAWSHDWNSRRQAAYEECGAQGNQEVGILACLPLADLFNVWAAEDDQLLGQDSGLMDVDTARQALQEDFSLIEQQ